VNPSPADQMIPDDFVTLYLLSRFSEARRARLDYPPRRSACGTLPALPPSVPGIRNYIIINCNDIRGRLSLLPFWLVSRRASLVPRRPRLVLIEVAYERPCSLLAFFSRERERSLVRAGRRRAGGREKR